MEDQPDDISIPYVFLADAAESLGGKLYVLGGGWDRLLIPQFPGQPIKPIAVALSINVPYTHTNKKFSLGLELIDAEGTQIGDSLQGAQFEAGRPPGLPQGASQNIPIAINTQPHFLSPGPHTFVASIDGEIKNRVAFTAMPLQQAPGFSPGAPPSNG
jgi:hypothetical protein